MFSKYIFNTYPTHPIKVILTRENSWLVKFLLGSEVQSYLERGEGGLVRYKSNIIQITWQNKTQSISGWMQNDNERQEHFRTRNKQNKTAHHKLLLELHLVIKL